MKSYDKLSLKKAYYRIFSGMIMIPLLLVLIFSLLILGMQYRDQAIENIRSVQQGIPRMRSLNVSGIRTHYWKRIPLKSAPTRQ